MDKKIYIIPGLGESTRSKNYRDIIKFAKNMGFQVISVKIDWKSNTPITDFIDQADKQIPKTSKEDYILGFSFGAYIAHILAKNKTAKGFIFCSTSPYFKNNLKEIPSETKKYFGDILMDSFKKYSPTKNNSGKAWFLIGGKDWKIAIDQSKSLCEQWKGEKNLFVIKNVGHELKHPLYLAKLKTILKKL